MLLIKEFSQLFNKVERAVATITGQRGGGKVIANTDNNAIIILSGNAETGKKVYYDRRSLEIIGEAPDVPSREYGI